MSLNLQTLGHSFFFNNVAHSCFLQVIMLTPFFLVTKCLSNFINLNHNASLHTTKVNTQLLIIYIGQRRNKNEISFQIAIYEPTYKNQSK